MKITYSVEIFSVWPTRGWDIHYTFKHLKKARKKVHRLISDGYSKRGVRIAKTIVSVVK